MTVYEDTEDGSIDGWLAYGDGTVANVEGAPGNRIIVTDGDVSGAPFCLGFTDRSEWNNKQEFIVLFTIILEKDAAVNSVLRPMPAKSTSVIDPVRKRPTLTMMQYAPAWASNPTARDLQKPAGGSKYHPTLFTLSIH